MRDHGTFFSETFRHLLFLGQIALGNEEREVGVHVAGVLEHPVECVVNTFPDRVAMGLDHHATAHGRIFG